MKIRLARKILRDPHRHSAHQLLIAARRMRPGWFDPGDRLRDVAYKVWSDGADYDGSRAERKFHRRCWTRSQGLHNWAYLDDELPF